ncbi:MAG: glycine dehydrogenase (aminomethyl-transferring), partial [Acidimicrobiia bacterium]|nr:glycine dehydrogenase (aminomethyl-transferring) [Acidimicrobiia bacterium]
MADAFAPRHIGPGPADIDGMLGVVGAGSLEELIDKAVPSIIRSEGSLDLPDALSESRALARLRQIADRNEVFTSMIGLGYTNTFTPAVIRRNVLQDPSWYTAYTPYQPEISQGRLEALLNFQTMVMDLTGMAIANASMLDEGTAAAEAMTMLRRVSKADGSAFFVADDIHPQTLAVIQTRAEPLGIDVVVGSATDDLPDGTFGAVIQYPGTSGEIPDLGGFIDRVHDAGGLVCVAADPLALVLLPSPGSLGADVVVGSTQRFGVPMGFGGPHAAYFATREEYKRTIPGRLVGVTRDAHGRQALRLALQTREQHIRRDKATSNICTAQVLLAVIAGMYGVYHGPDGLRTIARRVATTTAAMAHALRKGGLEVLNESAFDTLTVRVGDAHDVIQEAVVRRINLRLVDDQTVAFTVDETTTDEIARNVLVAFGIIDRPESDAASLVPAERDDEILTHPVFHRYRSETEMLRYLRRLSDKDIALDRAMIPLGSCTMKLNATSELLPLSWRQFSEIHP